MVELTELQRRVIESIGRGHASVQEIARELGITPQQTGKVVLSLSRCEPQMLHVSGADERLPVPHVADASPWDEDGNERFQLTISGIFQTKERVERAKRHMLHDYQEQGLVPPNLTYEDICRRYPSFWDTGKLGPQLRVIAGGLKTSA